MFMAWNQLFTYLLLYKADIKTYFCHFAFSYNEERNYYLLDTFCYF